MGGVVPNHIHGGLPPTAQCTTCHNTTTWTSDLQPRDDGFSRLTNAHQMAAGGGKLWPARIATSTTTTLWPLRRTDLRQLGMPFDHPGSRRIIRCTRQPEAPLCGSETARRATQHHHLDHRKPLITTTTGFPAGPGFSPDRRRPVKVVACNRPATWGNNYTLTAGEHRLLRLPPVAWQSTTTLGGVVPNHVAGGLPEPSQLLDVATPQLLGRSTFNPRRPTGFPR